eukprot:84712-Prymnesium_polylepis.2
MAAHTLTCPLCLSRVRQPAWRVASAAPRPTNAPPPHTSQADLATKLQGARADAASLLAGPTSKADCALGESAGETAGARSSFVYVVLALSVCLNLLLLSRERGKGAAGRGR